MCEKCNLWDWILFFSQHALLDLSLILSVYRLSGKRRLSNAPERLACELTGAPPLPPRERFFFLLLFSSVVSVSPRREMRRFLSPSRAFVTHAESGETRSRSAINSQSLPTLFERAVVVHGPSSPSAASSRSFSRGFQWKWQENRDGRRRRGRNSPEKPGEVF